MSSLQVWFTVTVVFTDIDSPMDNRFYFVFRFYALGIYFLRCITVHKWVISYSRSGLRMFPFPEIWFTWNNHALSLEVSYPKTWILSLGSQSAVVGLFLRNLSFALQCSNCICHSIPFLPNQMGSFPTTEKYRTCADWVTYHR